jgi:multiple sugar transport system permease protein
MSAVSATTARLRPRVRRWEGLPYWLILPAVAYIALFLAWPMVESFGLAFRVDGAWTLANFRDMVHEPQFGEAMRFTLLLIVVIVPVQFVLALAMALLVNAQLRGGGIFLYVFLLPLAVSDLAAGIVWSGIFTQQGYLNTVLQHVGLIDVPFIWIDARHQGLLLLTVVAAELWRSTALIMIILFSGLQGIPREYGEAAEVFGAGPLQRLRHVTLPALKPAIQAALVLRVVLAFEAFSTVIAITGSGTTVLAEQAYRWQVTFGNPGIAAAYSSLLLAMSLVAAGLIFALLHTPRERIAR